MEVVEGVGRRILRMGVEEVGREAGHLRSIGTGVLRRRRREINDFGGMMITEGGVEDGGGLTTGGTVVRHP